MAVAQRSSQIEVFASEPSEPSNTFVRGGSPKKLTGVKVKGGNK